MPTGFNDTVMLKRLTMKYLIHILPLMLFLMICLTGRPLKAQQEEFTADFDHQDQTLTIQADNIPLSVVLYRIQSATGAVFSVVGSQDPFVTDSFTRLPIKDGIERIAKQYSIAVIYQINRPSGRTHALHEIKEVWLFESGNPQADATGQGDTKPPPDKENQMAQKERVPHQENSQKTGDVSGVPMIGIQDFDQESTVGFWARQLFGKGSPDDKKQAVTELHNIGSDEALAVMSTALGQKDAGLRQHLVENLKTMDNDGTMQIIAQALIGDKETVVRAAALSYFIDRGDRISKSFLDTAAKDKDAKIRKMAREALNKN